MFHKIAECLKHVVLEFVEHSLIPGKLWNVAAIPTRISKKKVGFSEKSATIVDIIEKNLQDEY